MKEDWNN